MDMRRPPVQHLCFLRPIALLLVMSIGPSAAFAQSSGTVEWFSGGRTLTASLLIRQPGYLMALGRDGRLHEFEGSSADGVRTVPRKFEPITRTQMRRLLQSEYGFQFEVLLTNNFLVVQPRGRGRRWPDLFQHAHDAFTHYMDVRGVRTSNGNFPMVAIVMPDAIGMRNEFRRMEIDAGRVAGIYHPFSNRVVTHDGGHAGHFMETIRHEAAHQSGYNIGVHSRINDMPRWIVEGVGQMFEPEAMSDRGRASDLSDQINRDALMTLRDRYPEPKRFLSDLVQLVRHDKLFDGDHQRIAEAYAMAWGTMFYLGQQQPRRFAQLLDRTSRRQPFVAYDPDTRLRDLESIVGTSIDRFGLRIFRYIEQL